MYKGAGILNRNFFDLRVLAVISAVIITFSVSILLLQDTTEAENLAYDGLPRAVIIDQLYEDVPRDWFHQKASDIFEAAGYQVDIITTQNVTVDFYKKLPSMNYQFILIRSHGAEDKNDDSVTLFTGERYEEDRYIPEQLFGQVKKGAPLQQITFGADENNSSAWVKVNDTYSFLSTPVHVDMQTDDLYFLITPKLVNELMVGKFPDSILLIGGCSSLENTSMAKALIERGASSVVGWDDTIGDYENDIIMLQFLEETLINNKETKTAVDLVMQGYNWGDPKYNATLKHYPEHYI